MNDTLQDLILSLGTLDQSPALRLRTDFRSFTWSYGELARSIRAVAHWLGNQGLQKGDRVLLWAPNSPNWVSAFLSCLATGIVPVPLDLHSTADFVERVEAETNARLLLRGRYQTEVSIRAPAHFLDELEWETRPGQPELNAWPALVPTDLAEIVYTSGTTAQPRGVMLTHRNLVSNLADVQPVVPTEPFYRFVSLLPLSHAFEQVIGLLLPLSRGGQITYLQSLSPSALAQALHEERPNALVVVPRLLEYLRTSMESRLPRFLRTLLVVSVPTLLHLPLDTRRVLFSPIRAQIDGRLRYVVVGGAALDPSLERFWDMLGILVLQGYGLTEASPVVTANAPSVHRIGSVGKPLAHVRVRIAGDDEVLVRGPNVTPGYYQRPDETTAAFADGWFRSGDFGYFDPDGFLYLRGRKKDVIVTPAGLKVYPEDIEAALNRQPGVRDSVVVDWQNHVHAVLLLDPRIAAPPTEIVRRANEHLNPVQRIQGWTVWPQSDFPRTPTLKAQKYKVCKALDTPLAIPAAPSVPTSKVARTIQGLAPGRPVRPNARLEADLGLSSIDRLELIMLLEEEFHADIPEDLVMANTTVADLDDIVRHITTQRRMRPHRWPLWAPFVALRSVAQQLVVFPVLRCLVRLSVRGSENLEQVAGPVILAGNHVSHLDGPTLLMAMPSKRRRRTAVAALAGFYSAAVPNPIDRIAHAVVFFASELLLNVFPVPRAAGFRDSLRYAGFLMEHGWNIVIFPEGTRSPTGELIPFREGVGLLANELRATVIPFRIRGTNSVLPPHAWIPHPGHVEVHFGAPMQFPPSDPGQITQQIHDAVARM